MHVTHIKIPLDFKAHQEQVEKVVSQDTLKKK